MATLLSRPTFSSRVPRLQSQVLFWLSIVVVCSSTGLLYTVIFNTGQPHVSLIYAGIIGTGVMAFERGLLLPRLHRRMRQWPTLVYVPAAELVYVGIIAVGTALAGLITSGTGLSEEPLASAMLLTPRVLVFALAVSAAIVFVVRVRDLIGGQVFFSLLIGRYYRPVQEDRIFLFVDVVGSTRYAEAHGDLRAQEYLSAFFAALAEPVRQNGGSIDDYVGDMALVTWPMKKGVRNHRCIACAFDLAEQLERNAADWERRFGQVPRFRAALHGGPVVTAEVGIDRHKISYFGDAVNTTARVETLCRSLEAPILISHDLLVLMPGLPPGIVAQPRGEHVVHGRARTVDVLSLERCPPSVHEARSAAV